MQKKLTYTLEIYNNESEDKNIEITLVDNSSGKTSTTLDALVPAINQLRSTLFSDIESIL